MSVRETEYISYLQHTQPEKKFITAFSSAKGQYRFYSEIYGAIYPDAYSESHNEAVFFNG